MAQHVTHTHKNYFFRRSTQAALVKVMPSGCEGQFAEGKVIGNLLKHPGDHPSPTCSGYAKETVLRLTTGEMASDQTPINNKKRGKETAVV